MNKEDLHIDDFFRSELEELPGGMEVPSWDKVRGNIGRKRSRRKVFYYSAAAAGMLLLLGSSIFLRLLHPEAGPLTPGISATTANYPPHTRSSQQSDTISNRYSRGKSTGIQQDYPTATQTGLPEPVIKQQQDKLLADSTAFPGTLPVPGTLPEHMAAQPITAPGALPGATQPRKVITDDFTDDPTHKRAISSGFTIGYQRGFHTYAVNAPVISSFFQVDLNDKFAFSVQPALAYNSVQKKSLGGSAYHANVETQVQQTTDMTPDGPVYNYTVSLAYDSVQVGNTIGSGYWQAELPLYAHYKITRRLSFFTGVALRYTSHIPITQQVSQTPVSQSYVLENQPQYLPQGVIDDIVSNALPGNAYDPSVPEEMNRSGASTLSMSYGLGLKFQVGKRLGLEILGNKNLSGFKNISNENLRAMHQQPGLRMSVIYLFNAPSAR
jgi:hypothetical protein